MSYASVDPRLAEVLAKTGPVLLDFDGPVTPLMPAPLNWQIAEAMRGTVRASSISLPKGIAISADPLVVLRYAYSNLPMSLRALVEQVCIDGEVAAAQLCQPTLGGHETIRACRLTGRPIAIVSNNAPDAIDVYLDRYELRDLVLAVFARPHGRPDLMKPNPALVDRAVDALGGPPDQCVFVGDSVSDIQVSKATRVRSIGYAKSPGRGDELAAEGADAIVHLMSEIEDALIRSKA
jgi:phosphoglycolate phosphatase-like HAD superfamily hydrolase